jgi:hypothetical protein
MNLYRIKSKPVFNSILETTRFNSLLLSPNTLLEPSPYMGSPQISCRLSHIQHLDVLFQRLHMSCKFLPALRPNRKVIYPLQESHNIPPLTPCLCLITHRTRPWVSTRSTYRSQKRIIDTRLRECGPSTRCPRTRNGTQGVGRPGRIQSWRIGTADGW